MVLSLSASVLLECLPAAISFPSIVLVKRIGRSPVLRAIVRRTGRLMSVMRVIVKRIGRVIPVMRVIEDPAVRAKIIHI